MALNPGDTLNNHHYRIIRQLGRGGFGFVYLAHDTLLGEQVAIKELIPALVGDDDTLKRFLAEARATMRLTHKHIVRTHNVFYQGGNYYIVMEYMAGGSLEERLRAGGPLPVDEAVRVAAQVCEGLACAHEEQVVHCDLKPANILFDAKGHAKVADFGIAHVSGEMLTRSWITPAGFVAGTLPYMSPEQADGVRHDPRIDVYAVGAVLYRMLVGRPYLEFDQRETPGAQADNVLRIRNQQPVRPSTHAPHVPAWLDGIVLRALAKQPEARYAGVEAMRSALLRPPAPRAERPPRELASASRAPAPMPAWTRQVSSRPAASPASAAPRATSLPAWFWPAVGAALVLIVFLIVAIISLGSGGSGGQLVGVATATEATATETAAGTQAPTRTAEPTMAPVDTNTPTSTPTDTPVPTATPTRPPTDTPRPSATPTDAPIGELRWELRDNSGQVIDTGDLTVYKDDVHTERITSSQDGQVFYDQSIALNSVFAIGIPQFPEDSRPEAGGFALWLDRTDMDTFSWEWFEIQDSKTANKLQGGGQVEYSCGLVNSKWEFTEIRFVTDVVLRVNVPDDDMDSPDWTATIFKDSYIEWPAHEE